MIQINFRLVILLPPKSSKYSQINNCAPKKWFSSSLKDTTSLHIISHIEMKGGPLNPYTKHLPHSISSSIMSTNNSHMGLCQNLPFFMWKDTSPQNPIGYQFLQLSNDQLEIQGIRGNLWSKMILIRKCANNKFCELEFKNQQNFNK